MKRFILLMGMLSLTSCMTFEDNYAPVTEISVIEAIPKKGMHRVLPDETLYSIAWRYGLDYQDLAKHNRIGPPYAISVGQIIYLNKNKPAVQPVKEIHARPSKVVVPTITYEEEPTASVSAWRWPAKGRVIGSFSASNKGINIAGLYGDPVFATASGKVVYSGDGLRGYGNLIIIKHNSTFLTAYAHNSKTLVQSGEQVRAGQTIAEMGSSGASRVMLHFEIRQHGKPVNPLFYLRNQG